MTKSLLFDTPIPASSAPSVSPVDWTTGGGGVYRIAVALSTNQPTADVAWSTYLAVDIAATRRGRHMSEDEQSVAPGEEWADDPRDVLIARRRTSGVWLTEDEVMRELERTDG